MTVSMKTKLRSMAVEASLKPENKNKWCSAVKTDFGFTVWIDTRISDAIKATKYYSAIHAKNGSVYGEKPVPAPKPETPDMQTYLKSLLELDAWRDSEKSKIDAEYQRRLEILKKGSSQP